MPSTRPVPAGTLGPRDGLGRGLQKSCVAARCGGHLMFPGAPTRPGGPLGRPRARHQPQGCCGGTRSSPKPASAFGLPSAGIQSGLPKGLALDAGLGCPVVVGALRGPAAGGRRGRHQLSVNSQDGWGLLVEAEVGQQRMVRPHCRHAAFSRDFPVPPSPIANPGQGSWSHLRRHDGWVPRA